MDALYDRREIDVLHIHPMVMGAGGGGGLGQILIGAVMIAVAVFAPVLLPAMLTQGSVVLAGAMMVLGGVLQLLAPQPSINASNEEKSRYLGNGRNTVNIGTRIPMIYGRRKAYGHYISFDIDASIFDSAPAEWYSSPFTSYGELNYSAAPEELPMEPPSISYNQPVSFFTGMSYPAEMVINGEILVNFAPVDLTPGEYDINFNTGQTMHVRIDSTGFNSNAVVLGISSNNPPLVGTPIVFTQNYA